MTGRTIPKIPDMVRCEPCLGMGYKGHQGRSWRIRACRACGGSGQRPPTRRDIAALRRFYDEEQARLAALLPLCGPCIGSIGGAHGGPDAPYRPALEGEPCGAADCQGAPDDDDDEPDAYEVWNATGSFPK